VRGDTIARNYASALFELAEREDAVEAYGEGLELVARLLDETPGFALFLDTPRIEASEKTRVLKEAFGDHVPAHVLNFVRLVVDKRRQGLLREMAREYGAFLDDRLGRARVEVSVSRELDTGEQEEIRSQLSRILGREALPRFRVKKELLGGIVFRSGDMIFDGSVRRRLERMRRQLLTTDLSTD
jgi:F-type H+-transporting ATPase subunit delta